MLAAIIIMRPFLILIPSVLFFISCQNWTADKVVQKNVHDSVTKGDQTSISPTQAHSIDQDFLAFWQKFRIAVIALDTTQIMELTQFPFQIRGSFDSDPTIEYNRNNFVRVVKAFLSQGNGEGGTELDVIQKALDVMHYFRTERLRNVLNRIKILNRDHDLN